MGNSAPNPFQSTHFLMSGADLVRLPPAAPEVAFAGRSNAGKSSALNAVCAQRQLARVSKTPGRTQLINFFEVPALNGRLVDLPGYGYAQVPQAVRREWGALVEGFLERRESLRGIVLVMDVRHPHTDFDAQMLAWAEANRRPVRVILTKADKLGYGAAKTQLERLRRELPQVSVQLFSAVSQQGVDELRDALKVWLQAPADDA